MTLVDQMREDRWYRRLSLRALETGRVRLLTQQADRILTAVTENLQRDGGSGLQVCYSWDAPARWGQLSVACLRSGSHVSREVAAPMPLALADAMELFRTGDDLPPGVTALSLAGHSLSGVIDKGGLAGDALVDTPDGSQRLDTLRPGDAVYGPDQRSHRIARVDRLLRPPVGSYRGVTLPAGCAGLVRPLRCASGQELMISGSDLHYGLGVPRARAEARDLARPDPNGSGDVQGVPYYHAVLETPGAVRVQGALVLCPGARSPRPRFRLPLLARYEVQHALALGA